jgi:hypothetical protein
MMRLREQQHNQLLRQQPGMMPGQMPLNMRRNGMVPANLQKTVLQNNTGGLYVSSSRPVYPGILY